MHLGPILQLDIALKHIILGLKGISSQNEVQNIAIVIVMYAIYCTWVKCNVEKISYSETKVMQFVKGYISFCTNVFFHVFEDRRKSQLLKMYKEKICTYTCLFKILILLTQLTNFSFISVVLSLR